MSDNKRLKTKKELVLEYGNVWFCQFEIEYKHLLPYLGELVKNPKLRAGVRLPKEFLIDKLLLPLGTQVFVPFTKSIGENIEKSSVVKNSKNNILYYKGFNPYIGYHLLCSKDIEEQEDYFSASDILEAYGRYLVKDSFPLLELLMQYHGK